jgi:hypothetical protein
MSRLSVTLPSEGEPARSVVANTQIEQVTIG